MNGTELGISAVTSEMYCLYETCTSVIFPILKEILEPNLREAKVEKKKKTTLIYHGGNAQTML